MTVILKADIIEDVNDNLQTGFETDGTDLDKTIIKTLTDMSNRSLLVGSDDSQSLVLDDRTLAYPTGFRHAINITLTDSDGDEKMPLLKLKGGHKQYREYIGENSSSGKPEFYSVFNKFFWLWKPAGEAFTTLIEFYKDHPKSADSIEFETKFESVMFAGTTFWYAVKLNRTASIALWAPIYGEEMRLAVLSRNVQPANVRS